MKDNLYAITKALVLCVVYITLDSCKSEPSQLSNLQIQRLDSIATIDVPKDAPGVAVGIVLNGEIVYEKYAGYANLEDTLLIEKNSRFNIASNGKQFTALAILELIENGKLKLEDDIRTFFPELYPAVKDKITVAHLLNHSSGIRDVYDLWSLQGLTWWEHTFDNNDVLELLKKQTELNFVPGSKYAYSNSNYMLLAEIVAIVSESSFVDYTNKMFADLNMPNTSFVADHTEIKGPIAEPYFNFDTWFNYNWIWNAHGDGNIFSTLEDQLEFEKILQTKKNKRFSKEVLIQSQSLIPNSTIENYGYGVEFMEHQNIPYKYHGGSTGAWKAITARFENQNFSIVTLTNSGKTDPMTQTLNSANVLLELNPDTNDIKLQPDSIGPYVEIDAITGMYEIEGYIWEFVVRDEELFLLRTGRNDTKLIREADNVFQQWNDAPFKQEFTKNEKGEMQVTAYYPNTPTFTLTRRNTDFSDFDFKTLDGKYTNEETGVTFEINYQSDLKYSIKNATDDMTAILLSTEKLVINDYGYSLKIGMKKGDGTRDLFLTSGRIQNVRFSRVE